MLPTREEYMEQFNQKRIKMPYTIPPQWSDPFYICPKCGGNVRKNLWLSSNAWLSTNATTNAHTYISAYQCESCRFTEYMVD